MEVISILFCLHLVVKVKFKTIFAQKEIKLTEKKLKKLRKKII